MTFEYCTVRDTIHILCVFIYCRFEPEYLEWHVIISKYLWLISTCKLRTGLTWLFSPIVFDTKGGPYVKRMWTQTELLTELFNRPFLIFHIEFLSPSRSETPRTLKLVNPRKNSFIILHYKPLVLIYKSYSFLIIFNNL